MKAFISIDLEGMPYIVIPGHLSLKGKLYTEARKIASKITLVVAEELKNAGFDEILIADSHGPMVNLHVDDLPEYVEIIRGFPRPTSMVAGIEGCDVALFLGYHAKFGTSKSTFDHTYSGGSIRSLEMNGVELSEYLLNSYAAGDYNIPTILVAGDAQLIKDDVKQYTPWVESVALKHSLTRLSAKSSSMVKIEANLREGVNKAVAQFNDKQVKPLRMESPVNTIVTFLASHFADAAELLPIIRRKDGLTIEYSTKNVLESYKIFEFLVLAASGMTRILEQT
ncbi:MAG: M55 family metallopeptidase [Candidatus Hodarchaeales archaeon]|jgi:D-amino peptidase